MKITFSRTAKKYQATLGDLQYGTYLAVADQENSIYIKVSKKFGQGIDVNWPNSKCLLMNVTHGTLRAVKGSEIVTVYDGSMDLQLVSSASPYKKGSYQAVGKY